jgi:hypothetical protein
VGESGPDIDARDLVTVAQDEPRRAASPASAANAGFVRAKSRAARVSVLGSHGVALASATASANSFASFAAANHLPSSPGV